MTYDETLCDLCLFAVHPPVVLLSDLDLAT
jgi:hypothetical protein